MSNNSLINLGDLAKPIDTLVVKISNAVGTVYEPRRIKKVAEAEVEAEKIKAASEIEITDLHRRTERRRLEEDARQQKNMEDITAKAIPHINENADPDNMDDDWIANLFDKCRIVSNKEMQSLWARILAGEANTPGTYSKRTVNLLSDFDKSDADLFTKLCGFCWDIGYLIPLIFDVQSDIYHRHGIYFRELTHLDSIGLIQIGDLGFQHTNLPKRFVWHYYNIPLILEMPKDTDNQLEVGTVMLTKIGQELAPICGSQPVDGFYEYVKEQWKEYLPAD